MKVVKKLLRKACIASIMGLIASATFFACDKNNGNGNNNGNNGNGNSNGNGNNPNVQQMKLTVNINDYSDPSLLMGGTDTVTIDWGDGTKEKYALSSTISKKHYPHDYGKGSFNIIITGNVTYLKCGFLSHIDISKNTALTYLDCEYGELTSLDVSKNTALTSLNCYNNELTATALNSLFRTLHSNTINGKWISIGDNPGDYDCDQSIAEDKGWEVRYH